MTTTDETPRSTDATAEGASAPRKGTRVVFELDRTVALPVDEAWRRLCDWAGHSDWIPMTRVEVDPADPASFTAWTGLGKLSLPDRMRADVQSFDGTTGHCHVHKLGPVIVGEAEFTVAPGSGPGTTVVTWREDVTVPKMPRFLAKPVGWVSAQLFGLSLRRMVKAG